MRHFLPHQSVQAILRSFKEIGLETQIISDLFFKQEDVASEHWGVMASVDALMTLWKQAKAQSKEPYIFVRAGRAVPFGSFGIVDHLTTTASSMEEGLQTLSKNIALVSSTTVISFEESEGFVEIRFRNQPNLPIHDLVDQWLLGMFVQRMTECIGPDVPSCTLFLRTLIEPDPALDSILGYPVEPHPLYTGIRLPEEQWRKPLESSNPSLFQSLERAAEEMHLERFASAPLAYAVWNSLSTALHSGQSISRAVSDQLGVSVRTLQRRLRKERLSLSELLESFRKQEALRMLTEGLASLAEISSSLGYNEQSSFNRSFKRWTGLSPKRWLRKESHDEWNDNR